MLPIKSKIGVSFRFRLPSLFKGIFLFASIYVCLPTLCWFVLIKILTSDVTSYFWKLVA